MLDPQPPRPAGTMAVVSFWVAVLAVTLSIIGAYFTGTANQYANADGRTWLRPVFISLTYFVPIGLGALAIWLGSRGVEIIEDSGDRLTGAGYGMFAIILGTLSIIGGAIIIYARLIAGSPL